MGRILEQIAALPAADKNRLLIWWAVWLVWLVVTLIMTYRLIRAAIRLMRQKSSLDIAYEEGRERRRTAAHRRRPL
jgi:beta-lactamase regulating signal transducer with metallopeptidase domain